MNDSNTQVEIKKNISKLIKEFFLSKQDEFIPGKTPILTGLAVYDDKEINSIINYKCYRYTKRYL